MKSDEIEKNNSYMLEKARLANADVLEIDNGLIVGFGSHADYDTHAVDIMNGNGYYDKNGHYVAFPDDSD
ncbi:MAG: hypothetical protein K2J08_06990 [Ruminococcus sp.]|nr:hypothetical protein [Ruminococcus sp.]